MLTMAVTAADGTVKHYDALVNEALPANGGALTVSSITDASGMGPAAAPMLAAMGSVGSASAPTPAPSSAAAATAGVATMAAIVLALI